MYLKKYLFNMYNCIHQLRIMHILVPIFIYIYISFKLLATVPVTLNIVFEYIWNKNKLNNFKIHFF